MDRDRASKKLRAAAAAGLSLAGLAGAAHAQPADGEPGYADPRYAVELTPEEPGRYLHDGWYGRVAAGQGYVATQIAPPDGGGHETTGATACVDAAAGRTLNGVPGLALGVGFSACFAPEPQSTLSLAPLDTLLYVVTLGMTADGYPDPAAGFHVGGEWNFALLSTGEEGSSRAVGPG
ncbi:MAG: hypothetical protein IT373_18695, partial [Polyangiaceae bacterium]|nr:hypothetical protein [Polyangiaceae bacterium]